jgi:hypothetical protein
MQADSYAVLLRKKLEFSFCFASEMPAAFASVGWKAGKEGLVGVGVAVGPAQMHSFLCSGTSVAGWRRFEEKRRRKREMKVKMT